MCICVCATQDIYLAYSRPQSVVASSTMNDAVNDASTEDTDVEVNQQKPMKLSKIKPPSIFYF